MNNEAVHWVKKRSECTLDFTFMALWDLVQRDVQEVNEVIPAKRYSRTFKAERIEGGAHSIFRVQRNDTNSIFFHLLPTAITVATGNDTPLFSVVAEWNTEKA